ncbi:Sensor histidine kinase LiaS [Bremerella volcania]|uniref:histidine kinase n=1 Tax=Bremerella volcania TaxID=2527984 RepID=A0A518C2D9_9BACT|nr:histidine kinase [Bremerella volcania]QDU73389.1 Sensor histidine kinase LiaS [Bremerella volcania]
MQAKRTCCVIIAALGLLAAACGLIASLVPTLLPSPATATIFAILAIAITFTAVVTLASTNSDSAPTGTDATQENSRLKLELDTLRHLNAQLLEDKFFLQFLKADQDHERQLLALDLHDLTLPNLTSSLFQMEALGQRLSGMDDSLDGTIDLLRESMHQTRRVMNCLSPTLVQDEGVVASLQRLVDHFQASVDSVRFHHDVEFDRLSPLCECALIQLVREALDQIRRNRFAQNVELELVQEDDRLRLAITDDGAGNLADSPRIQDCLEILSGHQAAQHQQGSGHVMRVEFSVTDLIQSDTIKEKSRAFS